MNNKKLGPVELDTSIEQLHSTWIQTMFQMVTTAFLASTFIRHNGEKYSKYILIPHIIGFLTVITGIYSIYYTYKLDVNTYQDARIRLSNSRIVTIIILVCLLLIATFVFFI